MIIINYHTRGSLVAYQYCTSTSILAIRKLQVQVSEIPRLSVRLEPEVLTGSGKH